jgi:hypothetical protein
MMRRPYTANQTADMKLIGLPDYYHSKLNKYESEKTRLW